MLSIKLTNLFSISKIVSNAFKKENKFVFLKKTSLISKRY
jgi:hypothetical protein